MKRLLEVCDLHVHFPKVVAVDGISFHLNNGEIIGIVGESGSGKSVLAQALMQLISPPGKIVDGKIRFLDEDLLKKNEKEMQNIRGSKIGMIFQDPLSSLNPTMKIGEQIVEGFVRHHKTSKNDAVAHALILMETLGISDPRKRMEQYPFELSGGLRQRILIAIALICNPLLLIADEPTTALDTTIQAQILELLKQICAERGTSLLFITHDLGIVAGLCDRILVMHSGKIVESGTTDQIFYQPQHPYTKTLLRRFSS